LQKFGLKTHTRRGELKALSRSISVPMAAVEVACIRTEISEPFSRLRCNRLHAVFLLERSFSAI
jgi:hypothetical protein